MIGDSPFEVDQGVTYEGTEVLWELLIKKNVNRALVKPYVLKSYKRILESTSGHLSDKGSSGHIQTI